MNHKLLWEKTCYHGHEYKIFTYAKINVRKCNFESHHKRQLLSFFPLFKGGIRQGCNLSPLLFSLFINDLESYLSSNVASSVTLANQKVQLLLFTDDVVLLTDSIKGLQDLIDRLAEYCKTWKLNINVDKTKVVIFNRKQYAHQATLILDNMKLEFVTSYKYLGIILSSNGSFKPAISTLAKQASKALFSLFRAISKL